MTRTTSKDEVRRDEDQDTRGDSPTPTDMRTSNISEVLVVIPNETIGDDMDTTTTLQHVRGSPDGPSLTLITRQSIFSVKNKVSVAKSRF